MKKFFLLMLLFAPLVLFQSGCATILTGTFQEVEITSAPSDAEVFLNGDSAGKTPCALSLDQDTNPLIVLKKEGYADTRVKLKKGVNGWLVLNVFSGILPGLILDAFAGATESFNEDEISVPLLLPEETELRLYDGNVLLTNVSAEK